MHAILATIICLSYLPWTEAATNIFEVHEFLFMNKSILYLWKRRVAPKGDRFCLCYGSSKTMMRQIGAFMCLKVHKGALCRFEARDRPVERPLQGCLSELQLPEAPPHQYNTTSKSVSTRAHSNKVQCKAIDNVTTDVLGDFPGNSNLTFCSAVPCKKCLGGFNNSTYCTTLWTRDPFLRFEAVAVSDFMIRLNWSAHYSAKESFLIRTCVSEGSCYTNCFRESIRAKKGIYTLPTDLWRFKVTVDVYRMDGTTLYQKHFRSKRLAPDKPCFSTGIVKSWTEVRLYWWPHDESSDGHIVSWCDDKPEEAWPMGLLLNSTRGTCTVDAVGSSVTITQLSPFSRHVFSVTAYRWMDVDHMERVFSRPHRTHAVVMINPTFIPVFVLLAIPAVSVIISVVLVVTKVPFKRDSARVRVVDPPVVPRRIIYPRPPQLPPVVLRRNSRGDF
ncbi:uncharacterized protein LOC135387560 [Ornithodoros turicata]|uniref:uncharacterized protein LOC135387560 n=1 Tax=Ornithodoros turicata TaxID=34597 RepID=UPI00313A07EC